MAVPIDLEQVRAAPKVLLHDHLDGGLRPSTVLDLADGCGWRLPADADDEASLQAWFTRGADSRDILQYLATFEHTLAVMQTDVALERVAYECVVDLAADGVVYAEVRFAPELHSAVGLQAAIEAVAAGVRRGERDRRTITVNLIVCAMRTSTAERSMEIVQLVERMRYREPKVVAFDLAGAETGYPPSLHADALAFARRHQLNITIHASEPPDLELIADALAHGAHRIGHGVRLVKDMLLTPDGGAIFGDLARFVYDHRIPLELAPTCNVQIGAVDSLDDHPIGPFLRLGFMATINTDNRLMSGVSSSSEHFAVASTFGWGWREIEQAVTNGAMSAFAPLEDRRRLIRDVIVPAYAALRS